MVIAQKPRGNNKGGLHEIVPTISSSTWQENNLLIKNNHRQHMRIRKLTPKECWRLMAFDDGSFEKAQKVNSNKQLYKQAGNSIVVKVLEFIFDKLLSQRG